MTKYIQCTLIKKDYDSMLAIDLEEFKNADEFRAYLQRHDPAVDKAEAISIGWLFVLLADIAMMCVHFIRYGFRTIKIKKYSYALPMKLNSIVDNRMINETETLIALEQLILEVSQTLESERLTHRRNEQKLRAYARRGCDLIPELK